MLNLSLLHLKLQLLRNLLHFKKFGALGQSLAFVSAREIQSCSSIAACSEQLVRNCLMTLFTASSVPLFVPALLVSFTRELAGDAVAQALLMARQIWL